MLHALKKTKVFNCLPQSQRIKHFADLYSNTKWYHGHPEKFTLHNSTTENIERKIYSEIANIDDANREIIYPKASLLQVPKLGFKALN
jgi:hypothetical protein